jgi:hypothetical protein
MRQYTLKKMLLGVAFLSIALAICHFVKNDSKGDPREPAIAVLLLPPLCFIGAPMAVGFAAGTLLGRKIGAIVGLVASVGLMAWFLWPT